MDDSNEAIHGILLGRQLDGRVTVEANDLQGTPTVDGGEWIR